MLYRLSLCTSFTLGFFNGFNNKKITKKSKNCLLFIHSTIPASVCGVLPLSSPNISYLNGKQILGTTIMTTSFGFLSGYLIYNGLFYVGEKIGETIVSNE